MTPKALISDATAYFVDRASILPIEWAESAATHLRDTTFGYRVAKELDAWAKTEEPRLPDGLIRVAVAQLRKVKR